MSKEDLPSDCSQQWEMLLLLLSSEEKKIDRTHDSEVDVMKYFYNHKGVKKILHHWLQQMHKTYALTNTSTDSAKKSEEISLYWRQLGNGYFRNNNIEDSYKCYCKSVLFAQPGEKMYPLALANRSACLLKMKRFKECVSDIELAIHYGYPQEQRHKLYLRLTDCFIELSLSTKAKEALESGRRHAQALNLSAALLGEFERNAKVLETKMSSEGNSDEGPKDIELPKCLHGENTDFVSASSVLELKQSDEDGRHVVTKQATQRGDVLFSEEPYAFVALPLDGDMAIVCEGCCSSPLNPVPCRTCTRAVYCSEECRDVAWNDHHQWECVGAQSRLYPTIGIAHLALRVLLVSASKGFPVPKSKNCSDNEYLKAADVFKIYSDCDKLQIYKEDTPAFYRMFNLVTNFKKMNNVDYIQYALTATMLTLYLETFTKFFDYLSRRIPFNLEADQLRLFVSALVLRSLGQLVCNGHAALSLSTIEDVDGSSKTVSEQEVRHATAIYPSAAMMNHSCEPNIINSFYRCRLIIRCGRELVAGSEVLNCYGPHRAREASAHRRAQLRAQYMFNCNCNACSDSERRDFVHLFSAYSCQNCKGPVVYCGRKPPQCLQCQRTDFDLDRAALGIKKADELFMQAEKAPTLESRCEKLMASYKVKQQVWHRYHTALREDADRLARLHAEMGDYSKSVELIKHNIQSLEYQYGSFSVEVGHDLRKLADVMLERIIHLPHHADYKDWCMETHKILKKAAQLMELNYGSWEPLTQRLQSQERAMASLLADRKQTDAVDCVHRSLHYNLKI